MVGIVLVEPLHVMRAALELLIDQHPGATVLVQAEDAKSALAGIASVRRRRCLMLVSLSLTGEEDAFWLIRSVRDRFPLVSILTCGAEADGVLISRALFAGADGFVHKNSSPDAFIEAIHRTVAGEVVLEGLPPGALGSVAEQMEVVSEAEAILTGREIQVMTAASEGLTARQIGRRLGVRERTVTTHLGRIYKKLGANGRVSALTRARGLGLVATGVRE